MEPGLLSIAAPGRAQMPGQFAWPSELSRARCARELVHFLRVVHNLSGSQYARLKPPPTAPGLDPRRKTVTTSQCMMGMTCGAHMGWCDMQSSHGRGSG